MGLPRRGDGIVLLHDAGRLLLEARFDGTGFDDYKII